VEGPPAGVPPRGARSGRGRVARPPRHPEPEAGSSADAPLRRAGPTPRRPAPAGPAEGAEARLESAGRGPDGTYSGTRSMKEVVSVAADEIQAGRADVVVLYACHQRTFDSRRGTWPAKDFQKMLFAELKAQGVQTERVHVLASEHEGLLYAGRERATVDDPATGYRRETRFIDADRLPPSRGVRSSGRRFAEAVARSAVRTVDAVACASVAALAALTAVEVGRRLAEGERPEPRVERFPPVRARGPRPRPRRHERRAQGPEDPSPWRTRGAREAPRRRCGRRRPRRGAAAVETSWGPGGSPDGLGDDRGAHGRGFVSEGRLDCGSPARGGTTGRGPMKRLRACRAPRGGGPRDAEPGRDRAAPPRAGLRDTGPGDLASRCPGRDGVTGPASCGPVGARGSRRTGGASLRRAAVRS
jgi:hypothetical protein